MKFFKKSVLLVISIVILLVIFNSLIIGMPKKGIVVDSITKKPMEGIYLVRETSIITSGIENSSETILRLESILTDINGKFYFSPFIKLKFPFGTSYRELLDINFYGKKHYDEKGNTLDSKHDATHLGDIYGLGFSDGLILKSRQSYKQNGVTYKPFTNKLTINLAPIVLRLDDCKNNDKCIEKNEGLARNCVKVLLDQSGSNDICKIFSLKGAVILKNNIPFLDTSDDFIMCNSEADDASATLCVSRITSFSNAIVSEPSCSSITYETARNLCYFNVATNFKSESICNKITKKPIQDAPPYPASKYWYNGIVDYNTMCFKELLH